jgi:hypothetical protein
MEKIPIHFCLIYYNITSMVKGCLLATEGYDWRAEGEPVIF